MVIDMVMMSEECGSQTGALSMQSILEFELDSWSA
jgi:hypothetical protein